VEVEGYSGVPEDGRALAIEEAVTGAGEGRGECLGYHANGGMLYGGSLDPASGCASMQTLCDMRVFGF
jgi:hypothetical protein